MELLQTIYNHSDAKTTRSYIGLTKKKVDQYYDDMGDFCADFIMGDKQYAGDLNVPVVHMASSDLRDIIRAAYQAGRDNVSEVDAMFDLISMAEQLAK